MTIVPEQTLRCSSREDTVYFPQRIDLNRTFRSCSDNELLSYAHYLLDGLEELANNPEKEGRTGRHLGAVQVLLSAAGWYTLDEIMHHNWSGKE